MLNKVAGFIREQKLMEPGEHIICAVSGGADSVALLFALYLLKEKLHITLSAAHFNHGLRGEESDGDEAFVEKFCSRYDIPLTVGRGEVKPGAKGLEAAAREARYGFLRSLPGKIATAHTADDNGETVLLHLIRGTGLKGLGGIAPVNAGVIRPMLTVTRQEVEAFLEEYYLPHREDGSNHTDAFLRNRIRHKVVPILKEENPSFAENASAMALRLRQDEDFFRSLMTAEMPGCSELRRMHPAMRNRYLERFLKENGVPEPEQAHIAMLEALVNTPKPSAKADFPGCICLARNYDRLERITSAQPPKPVTLTGFGSYALPQWGIRVEITPAQAVENTPYCFTAAVGGTLTVRSRQAGDSIRLPGGSKQLKKLMIDRKIPAAQRPFVPVLTDEAGLVGVFGIGIHQDRIAEKLPAVTIRMDWTEKE